jgi:hypothetical protein
MKKKLSAHITMKEAIFSATAERCIIDNTPNKEQLDAMEFIAEEVFEPLREHFDVPIGLTSFFRSKALNAYLRGSKTSQHCKGQAMDIDADLFGGISNRDIFIYIMKNLDFDQLIWEYGDNDNPNWVHVSLKKDGKNRKQIKRAYKVWVDGGYVTKYKTWQMEINQ